MKKILFVILLILLPSLCFAGSKTASGVTADTLIDRVRYDLNETTASFWSDTELLQWMDEAVKEIASQTRCLETSATTQVLSSQTRSYSISSTFLDIEKVEYDSGVTTSTVQIYDLDRVPFMNLRLGREKERGSPKTYAVWNNTLYIWPIPTSAESGTSLYIYLIPVASGVTSTASAIETPRYFDGAILDYIKAKAWYKDGHITMGKHFESLFYTKIQSYILNVLRRDTLERPQTQN